MKVPPRRPMLSEHLWKVNRYRDHYQLEAEKRRAAGLACALLASGIVIYLIWRFLT